MTYHAHETSVEGGSPVELYTIQVGTEQPYLLTSSEDEVTIDGDVYTPETIKREKAEDGPPKRSAEFSFEMPAGHGFPRRYAGIIPGARVSLRVARYHRGDGPTPQLNVVFDGWIETVKVERHGHLAKVIARQTLAALSHSIPPDGYQSQCNNVLFGPRCGVDPTNPAFRAFEADVDGVDGRILTVSAAATFLDGWFTGGRASVDGDADHRLIVSHTGTEVELILPFVEPPDTVTLYAGCAHNLPVCVDKFGNGINFRAFHLVPRRNPYADGVV